VKICSGLAYCGVSSEWRTNWLLLLEMEIVRLVRCVSRWSVSSVTLGGGACLIKSPRWLLVR
jgi:hypothetical protein